MATCKLCSRKVPFGGGKTVRNAEAMMALVVLTIAFSAAFTVSASAAPVEPTASFSGTCDDLIVTVDEGTATHDTFPVYINGGQKGYAHPASWSSPVGFTVANGDVVEVYANPRLGDGGVVIATLTVSDCHKLAFTGLMDGALQLGIAVGLFLLGLLLLAFVPRKREETT